MDEDSYNSYGSCPDCGSLDCYGECRDGDISLSRATKKIKKKMKSTCDSCSSIVTYYDCLSCSEYVAPENKIKHGPNCSSSDLMLLCDDCLYEVLCDMDILEDK